MTGSRLKRSLKIDPDSPYSVVAFRRLQPSEVPAALVYRQRWVPAEGESGHFELLVRSWAPKLRLRLENTGPVPVQFRVLTPQAQEAGLVAAGQETLIEVATLDEQVAEIAVYADHPGLVVHVLP